MVTGLELISLFVNRSAMAPLNQLRSLTSTFGHFLLCRCCLCTVVTLIRYHVAITFLEFAVIMCMF